MTSHRRGYNVILASNAHWVVCMARRRIQQEVSCFTIARLPMLVDTTNFGLVLYNHANLNRFEETSSYWLVKRISVFLCFSLVNQPHTSGITVYDRTVTNIENTVRRAKQSCNSWFLAGSTFSIEKVLHAQNLDSRVFRASKFLA